jgi:hypothetical protein
MVAFCREAAVPGHHLTVQQGRPLPFANGAFRLITAYSVFTHLPRPIFEAWMDELLRVTAPGGLIVFTVEPERFLDFVAGIDPSAPESGWHAALTPLSAISRTRGERFARTGYHLSATGGGPFRGPRSTATRWSRPALSPTSFGGTAARAATSTTRRGSGRRWRSCAELLALPARARRASSNAGRAPSSARSADAHADVRVERAGEDGLVLHAEGAIRSCCGALEAELRRFERRGAVRVRARLRRSTGAGGACVFVDWGDGFGPRAGSR